MTGPDLRRFISPYLPPNLARDPTAPSPRVYSILATLRLPDDTAEAVQRAAKASREGVSSVSEIIAASCGRQVMKLRERMRFAGAPDELRPIPYLHQVAFRCPKRAFTEWARSAAAQELLSGFSAVRNHRLRGPRVGKAVGASILSGLFRRLGASWEHYLSQTGIAYMHDKGWRGTGQIAGALDSGVDTSHKLLPPAKIGWFARFSHLGSEVPRYPCRDEHWHGTQVAGLLVGGAAGQPMGGAPEARIAMASAMNCPTKRTDTTWAHPFQYQFGLGWLIALKEVNHVPISVVNLSLVIYEATAAGLGQIKDALELMAASRMQPVVAAGNIPHRRSHLVDHGLGVGSLHANGVRIWPRSGLNPKLVAPGHRILCCKPVGCPPLDKEKVEADGTSLSCALVSAGLLLLQEATGLQVGICTEALLEAARRNSLATRDRRGQPHRWGEGPLDVRAALGLLQSGWRPGL
jgi:hypothetical protein